MRVLGGLAFRQVSAGENHTCGITTSNVAYCWGIGGVLGNGQQFVSWISMRDLVAIVDFIIKQPHIKGPVNVVSPIPTNNRILTETLGRVLNRPTLFRIPGFVVKLLFGQMAEEMLLCSTRVTPKVLLEADYNFQDQSLEAVLRYCLEPDSAARLNRNSDRLCSSS